MKQLKPELGLGVLAVLTLELLLTDLLQLHWDRVSVEDKPLKHQLTCLLMKQPPVSLVVVLVQKTIPDVSGK